MLVMTLLAQQWGGTQVFASEGGISGAKVNHSRGLVRMEDSAFEVAIPKGAQASRPSKPPTQDEPDSPVLSAGGGDDFENLANDAVTTFDENKVYQGRVTYFNQNLGYGYITESVSEQDVFIHTEDLIDEIETNDRVYFRITASVKGPRAYDVQIVPVYTR